MQINVKKRHRKVGHHYRKRLVAKLKKASRAKMKKSRAKRSKR